MIGILLISHGGMAEGMIDSVELIMGVVKKVESVSLVAGEDFEAFRIKVYDRIRSLNDGDGVLVLVDLFGASPFNASNYAALKLQEEKIHARVLAGMNLPMLLETISSREMFTLDELHMLASNTGKDGIAEPFQIKEEENDGDY